MRARVKEVLANADSLSWSLIQRCDLEGRFQADVARELGISERHLRRKRQKALVTLGRSLRGFAIGKLTQIAVEPRPERKDMALAHARALSQTGRLEDALSVLDEAEASSEAVVDRWRIVLGRVRLLLDAECPVDDERMRWRSAEHRPIRAADDTPMEALAVAIDSMLELDRTYSVDPGDRLKRLLSLLRTECVRTSEPGPIEAYATILTALASRSRDAGEFQRAVSLSDSAVRVVQGASPRIDPAVCINARTALAQARLFAEQPLLGVMQDLRDLRQEALDRGLMRLVVKTVFSLVYAEQVRGRPRIAMQLGESFLPTVRRIDSGATLEVALANLAGAALRCGEIDRCLQLVTEVHARRSTVPTMSPLLNIYATRVHLLKGNFLAALSSSQCAVNGAVDMNLPRPIGLALHQNALALEGLGEKQRASRAIVDSLRQLKTHGAQWDLRSTVRDAIRITGNRSLVRAALR